MKRKDKTLPQDKEIMRKILMYDTVLKISDRFFFKYVNI